MAGALSPSLILLYMAKDPPPARPQKSTAANTIPAMAAAPTDAPIMALEIGTIGATPQLFPEYPMLQEQCWDTLLPAR